MIKDEKQLKTISSYLNLLKGCIENKSITYRSQKRIQNAVAQVLELADKEIELLEQKKGLMQVLLTGEKRLVQKPYNKD